MLRQHQTILLAISPAVQPRSDYGGMAAQAAPRPRRQPVSERGHASNPGNEALRLEVQEARAKLATTQAAALLP